MVVVSKRTFRPYDDSRNPRYEQTPINYIWNNLHKNTCARVPILTVWRYFQRVPEWNSKRTYVRNAATRAACFVLQSHNYQHSTHPKFNSASKLKLSEVHYYLLRAGNDTMTRHKYNKKYTAPKIC